ncbi:sel1 repeat family protein [Sneathiella marina]|uniref:Sel1 repeat family protein n=1 Tax=Sneathiella marina TaxID=2950108 RepID=A0ABY4W5I8_9PROT|nr:tetratricopeptide repeat protein [Sneathiella marina]USG60559.1 sel1 repeat family protein [Sneathiella marina]
MRFLFLPVILFLVACNTTTAPPSDLTLSETQNPYFIGWYTNYSELCARFDGGGGAERHKTEALKDWYGNDPFFKKGYAKNAELLDRNRMTGLTRCERAIAIVDVAFAGQGVLQSDETAIEKIEMAANEGDVVAQNNLGRIYSRGQTVPLDYQLARKWFTMAATEGFAPAQNNLGDMYANTRVLAKNYEEGLKWYRRAADQGHRAAQFNLGRMYYYGQAVELDYGQSLMWYSLAARQGHAEAIVNKRRLERKMTGEAIKKAQVLVDACLKKGFAGC